MGYNDGITNKDIERLNGEERERVEDASNLYISLKKAAEEGDLCELEKQVYLTHYARSGCLHKDTRFTDKRLNHLVYRMKRKYADSEMVSNESIQIGNQKIGGMVDRKAFDESEIDDMMITFLFSFNDRFITLEENTHLNVSSIYSFEADTESYSYNKLMSYIIGSEGKKGMFEISILRTMEKRRSMKRHMQNGISDKVNLNDLDEVRYEDINTPEDADGNKMMVDDLLGGLDEHYADVDGEVTKNRY